MVRNRHLKLAGEGWGYNGITEKNHNSQKKNWWHRRCIFTVHSQTEKQGVGGGVKGNRHNKSESIKGRREDRDQYEEVRTKQDGQYGKK